MSDDGFSETTDAPAWKLRTHTRRLIGRVPVNRDPADYLADQIAADPQAHIDALVEAGVLEGRGAFYAVVQPHKHEWRAVQVDITRPACGTEVEVHCPGCGMKRRVPNRLPIEVPE